MGHLRRKRDASNSPPRVAPVGYSVSEFDIQSSIPSFPLNRGVRCELVGASGGSMMVPGVSRMGVLGRVSATTRCRAGGGEIRRATCLDHSDPTDLSIVNKSTKSSGKCVVALTRRSNG